MTERIYLWWFADHDPVVDADFRYFLDKWRTPEKTVVIYHRYMQKTKEISRTIHRKDYDFSENYKITANFSINEYFISEGGPKLTRVQALKKLFDIFSIDSKHSQRWSVFLNGHGTYSCKRMALASMPIDNLLLLLKEMQSRDVESFSIISCYAGGILAQKFLGTQTFKFPIYLSTISEIVKWDSAYFDYSKIYQNKKSAIEEYMTKAMLPGPWKPIGPHDSARNEDWKVFSVRKPGMSSEDIVDFSKDSGDTFPSSGVFIVDKDVSEVPKGTGLVILLLETIEKLTISYPCIIVSGLPGNRTHVIKRLDTVNGTDLIQLLKYMTVYRDKDSILANKKFVFGSFTFYNLWDPTKAGDSEHYYSITNNKKVCQWRFNSFVEIQMTPSTLDALFEQYSQELDNCPAFRDIDTMHDIIFSDNRDFTKDDASWKLALIMELTDNPETIKTIIKIDPYLLTKETYSMLQDDDFKRELIRGYIKKGDYLSSYGELFKHDWPILKQVVLERSKFDDDHLWFFFQLKEEHDEHAHNRAQVFINLCQSGKIKRNDFFYFSYQDTSIYPMLLEKYPFNMMDICDFVVWITQHPDKTIKLLFDTEENYFNDELMYLVKDCIKAENFTLVEKIDSFGITNFVFRKGGFTYDLKFNSKARDISYTRTSASLDQAIRDDPKKVTTKNYELLTLDTKRWLAKLFVNTRYFNPAVVNEYLFDEITSWDMPLLKRVFFKERFEKYSIQVEKFVVLCNNGEITWNMWLLLRDHTGGISEALEQRYHFDYIGSDMKYFTWSTELINYISQGKPISRLFPNVEVFTKDYFEMMKETYDRIYKTESKLTFDNQIIMLAINNTKSWYTATYNQNTKEFSYDIRDAKKHYTTIWDPETWTSQQKVYYE